MLYTFYTAIHVCPSSTFYTLYTAIHSKPFFEHNQYN